MSYTNHKYMDIGLLGWLFESSDHMARTLRPEGTEDIKRAHARACGRHRTGEKAGGEAAEFGQEISEMKRSTNG